MSTEIWLIQICAQDFTTNFPSEVPSSYSAVAIGVPAQWNLDELTADFKERHPTITTVGRLFIKGGVTISKIRIDFSSHEEVQKIMKNKRILLDDANTSSIAQHYSPPFGVLRCYTCQRYNDYIAANCPHKDNPTCLRCGQRHA